MRAFVTVFMVGVLLGQSGYNLARVLHYAAEYDHYVNVLCENRDRPELHCNGACHLKKELAESPEPAAPSLPEIESTALWMLMAPAVEFQLLGAHDGVRSTRPMTSAGAVCAGWLRRIEHPPGMGLHLC